MRTLDEVGREADAVRSEIELLCVRGLASSTPNERRKLGELASEWERLGAGHVASRLSTALAAIDRDAKEAPRAVLSAYSSLHVFERLLSVEAAIEAWEAHLAALEDSGAAGGDAPEPPAAAPKQAPPIEERESALGVLDELSRTVEDLVRTGLTSATRSTREKLDASFKEASRRKLLRLGAALRYVNEEVGRFLADDGTFAARRFAFFLHRSWLLARGVAKGIREGDPALLASLLSGAAPPELVPWLEVVTLGVLKRTLANASTFDFKLRIVAAPDPSLLGQALTYSLVFPRKKEAKDLPSEAYLQLPQPQKFVPKILLEGKRVKIALAALSQGRLVLGPKSTMTEGGEHTGWSELYRFDARGALARVRRAAPGPLDLAVELQEEVFARGASLSDEPIQSGDGKRVFSIVAEGALELDAVIPDGTDGDNLLARLRAGLDRKKKPLLYGIVYYELGRLVLLPLSLAPTEPRPAPADPEPAAPDKKKKKKSAKEAKAPAKASMKAKAGDEPDLVTISERKFDVSALVGALGL